MTLRVRRDGAPIATLVAAPGERLRVPVGIEHGGPNVVELEVDALPDELTAINNKAVLTITGVRDKLKVLLVSGEPHAGERMWRNILKSDANVDLVHFTILRPPEKQDGTPINELSLIAFPTADLFGRKISEFDLIVFDRYSNQSVLPLIYFDNIVALCPRRRRASARRRPRFRPARRALFLAARADLSGPARRHPDRARLSRRDLRRGRQTSGDPRPSRREIRPRRPGAPGSAKSTPRSRAEPASSRAPTKSRCLCCRAKARDGSRCF